jgi:MOSC domain-containing protein YiiM
MATIERILVRRAADGPAVELPSAALVPGRGIEGDRYFEGTGTFSGGPPNGRALTLIEAEALDAVAADGVAVSAEQAGRNVVTRGADLNGLVGRRFRLGEVECVGDRLCEPCATLQERTQPGVLRALAGRGGLRADVVSGGTIAPGDELVVLG